MSTLHLLIVGSRSIVDYRQVGPFLDNLLYAYQYDDYEVVSGGAVGVDSLAEIWADKHHYNRKTFKPDWKKYGKRAGFIRNREMHEYLAQFDDRLVVILWDGESKGTESNFKLCGEFGTKYVLKMISR